MEVKQDHRKKMFMPLDIKNDIYTSSKPPIPKGEPGVVEYLGKKKSTKGKCWGCGGDHFIKKN